MNEMKIRFNQKALTTLDKNVQSNNEQAIILITYYVKLILLY